MQSQTAVQLHVRWPISDSNVLRLPLIVELPTLQLAITAATTSSPSRRFATTRRNPWGLCAFCLGCWRQSSHSGVAKKVFLHYGTNFCQACPMVGAALPKSTRDIV